METRPCLNCGREISKQAKFCEHCGSKLYVCPHCGNQTNKETAFCAECGATLSVVEQEKAAIVETKKTETVNTAQKKIDPKSLLNEWKNSSGTVKFLFGAGHVIFIIGAIVLMLGLFLPLIIMFFVLPSADSQIELRMFFDGLRCSAIFLMFYGIHIGIYAFGLGYMKQTLLCKWIKQKGLDSYTVAGEVLKLMTMEEVCKLKGWSFNFVKTLQSPQILCDAAFFNAKPGEKKRYVFTCWLFMAGKIVREVLFVIVDLKFLGSLEEWILDAAALESSSMLFDFENQAMLLFEMPIFWIDLVIAISLVIIVAVCRSQTKKARAAWLYSNFKTNNY